MGGVLQAHERSPGHLGKDNGEASAEFQARGEDKVWLVRSLNHCPRRKYRRNADFWLSRRDGSIAKPTAKVGKAVGAAALSVKIL
jgi:hypothetical protein